MGILLLAGNQIRVDPIVLGVEPCAIYWAQWSLKKVVKVTVRDFHALCVKITPLSSWDLAGKAWFWPKNELAFTMLFGISESRHCGEVVRRDERHMRTLLRRVSTGLYFQGPDRWTRNPTEAHNFKLIDRAVEFVQKWHLRDMELAFVFDDPHEVTRVPIDKLELRYSES